MKKFPFLFLVFAATPFLAQSEESGIKVQTPDGSFEVKTGTPTPPPDPKIVVVRPNPQVVEKTTVVEQPRAAGCNCKAASQ